MTEPSLASSSSSDSASFSSSSYGKCSVRSKDSPVEPTRTVGNLEPQPTGDVKAIATAEAEVRLIRNSTAQNWEEPSNGSVEKEAADKMIGMTRNGRPRQRKTAVYKGFWGDEDGSGRQYRSGSGSLSSGVESDEEMVRFPCVERLIEMYANIIKQQETETKRFMSAVVSGARGDEREVVKQRLDKTVGAVGSSDKTGANNVCGTQPGSVGSPASAEQLETTSASRKRTNESPTSDDGWTTNPQSPYCSSDEDSSGNQMKMKIRDKVTRSSSSDSALGLDEDLSQQEQQQIISSVGKTRRLTLGVADIPLRSALLPVPEPTLLPTSDSSTIGVEHCPTIVRSKMILEAQLIELPLGSNAPLAESVSTEAFGCQSNSISRRESAQSYVSDSGTDGVRYVRTPSVVVSDYSDETMCGITLEEIEYLRRHQLRRASIDCESDVSAASSCSNLNYCGSSISALEGCDYQCGLRTPERKVSDCSTCSTLSIDEEDPVLRQRLQELSLRPPGTADGSTEQEATKRRVKNKVSYTRHHELELMFAPGAAMPCRAVPGRGCRLIAK
ncbi:uncharacterized protein LOC131427522 [Malaya genurostris]|uniref:uncharacterized protein LOC131427522 n=1 Tax=Malaya genurostris TaxID=325434 RepID=UPI0026F3D74B|nr:uncharacterized protein LOC131427522 [Malaya genurostris]